MSMQPNFHTSALFASGRAPGPPAVITLVLIENSRIVSASWPDLRDHYVRILLGRLEAKHPEATVCLLFFHSCWHASAKTLRLVPLYLIAHPTHPRNAPVIWPLRRATVREPRRMSGRGGVQF